MSPSDAARAFAAAAIRHDDAAAADLVTGESRADFLALMDLSGRLQRVRGDVRQALAGKFRTARTGRSAPAVNHVEVVAERTIGPALAEVDVRLFKDNGGRPGTVTWRAVHENGAWKIEPPQCASPQNVAQLKRRLNGLLDAHVKTLASINRGEFATARAALRSLVEAEAAVVGIRFPNPVLHVGPTGQAGPNR